MNEILNYKLEVKAFIQWSMNKYLTSSDFHQLCLDLYKKGIPKEELKCVLAITREGYSTQEEKPNPEQRRGS